MKTPEPQDRFNPRIIVCPTGKPAGKYNYYQAHLEGAHGLHFIGTFKLQRHTPIEPYVTLEVEKIIKERKWDISKHFILLVICEDATGRYI